MVFQKKAKMKKNSYNKGLLLPWLVKALNEELYNGLKWYDRQRKIFYILWTHKSAEQWSKNDLEPFEAWAEHKGKLRGKNEKQLKATFRCALNSKKELKEVGRTRSKRFWQFVDPEQKEKENSTTKKTRKAPSSSVDHIPSSNDSYDHTCTNSSSSLTFYPSEAQITASPKLPKFDAICPITSLTTSRQDNEIYLNPSSIESELPQDKTSSEGNYRLHDDPVDHIVSGLPSVRISNSFPNSPPSFESSSKENETPSDDCHITSQLLDPSKDVWQPNGLTTNLANQDLNNFYSFFSNGFDEMPKSLKQKTDSGIRMEFVERDQSVPVMNLAPNEQIINRNMQVNYPEKTTVENNQYELMNMEEGCLLDYDFQRIIQELNGINQSTETGLYDYHS